MKLKKPKFIFVVGGVLSGVGKGITTASLGAIMKSKGFSVTALKADPYINVDAGTMNPTEHGEVFVTNDADECDQDMGNYERFLDVELTKTNYMTTGRVYMSVINKERTMKYKGKCVEVVPHIPEEIIGRIKKAQKIADADITFMEIGGTVGEYQNLLFLEAVREMKLKNPDDIAIVLVSYMPVPSHLGEMKTKPTQHAQKALNSVGLHADIIVARGPMPLDEIRKQKLAMLCGVKKDNSISAPDVESIYEIPLKLEEQNMGNKLLDVLGVKSKKSNIDDWKKFVKKIKTVKKEVNIAVIGKYFGTGDYTLSDSYISVIEAVKHAAWFNNAKPVLTWIDSEEFEKSSANLKKLSKFDAMIVPGGFGTRGVEGIIKAIGYAREKKIPYLGICYGMQLASIEFVRNVLGKKKANTMEMDENTKEPVIIINPFQAKNVQENRYGGTMRLGAYDCALRKDSISRKAYGEDLISERHRHRYEFNNDYAKEMDKAGLEITGINPESGLVEIVELKGHPFFVGVQYHPEFKSKPMKPHPLFREFVKAGLKRRK